MLKANVFTIRSENFALAVVVSSVAGFAWVSMYVYASAIWDVEFPSAPWLLGLIAGSTILAASSFYALSKHRALAVLVAVLETCGVDGVALMAVMLLAR